MTVKSLAPVSWDVEGNLPAGLTFSNGTLSGTPAEEGTFNVKFTASNAAGEASKNLTLRIKAAKVKNTKSAPDVRDSLAVDEFLIPDSKSQPAQKLFIVNDGNKRKTVKIPDDFEIAAVLPEVYVTEGGLYDFDVEISADIEAGRELIWLACSEKPSEDDEIAEFYDIDGAEISAVPESHKITVSAWLNENIIYSPVIAVKKE